MNQAIYKSMNDQIEPSQELIQSTIKKVNRAYAEREESILIARQSASGHLSSRKKLIWALIVFIIVCVLSITIGLLTDEAVRAGRIRIKPTQVSLSSEEGQVTESQPFELDSDWVKVLADNGKVGYVYGVDLDDEDNQPKTPFEALEYMERMATAPDRILNVYAEDKITVIGTFTVHNQSVTLPSNN